MLGVREKADIEVSDGRVLPEKGGMSVSPSKDCISIFFIPKSLGERYPGARGSNAKGLLPWRFGEGDFCDGPFCNRLKLRLDPKKSTHAFVEPDAEMAIYEYRQAIEATQPRWEREDW